MNKWSSWEVFSPDNVKAIGANKPGVYQFRVMAKAWTPKKIDRVRGADVSGTIYIGRSRRWVCARVKSFYYQVIGRRKDGHIAAAHFLRHGYKKVFPIKKMQFRYLHLSRKQAVEIEARLINKYLHQFYDMPPLNFQLPVLSVHRPAGRGYKP